VERPPHSNDARCCGASARTVQGYLPQLQAANGRPILFRGGMILSMDPQVGDFENGEMLIQGKKIVAVGTRLQTAAEHIHRGCANRILMPGHDRHPSSLDGHSLPQRRDGLDHSRVSRTRPAPSSTGKQPWDRSIADRRPTTCTLRNWSSI
jgi:hypothetical protein